MAFNIDENGNITLIQGDSGSLVINGLKTDKNYTVFFAIQDSNRKPVGNELQVNTNKASSIVFELTGDFPDLLTVPQNASCEIYYYGVKLCLDKNFEDTLIIGNSDIGTPNTITVFPKKVEGA